MNSRPHEIFTGKWGGMNREVVE